MSELDEALYLSDEEFDALSLGEQDAYLRLLHAADREWRLTGKQISADQLADQVDELLYGGAAGGGKSEWILHRAHRLSQDIPGHKTLILRTSFPELRRSLIRRSVVLFAQHSRPENMPIWRASHKEWRYPNGSVIECGYCVGGETMIAMGDGTYKAMAAIRVGDMVETLEGPKPVLRHWRVGSKPAVRMTTPSGASVSASLSHAVLSSAGQWLPPSALCGGPTPTPPGEHESPPTNGSAPSSRPPSSSSHRGLRRVWPAARVRLQAAARQVIAACVGDGRTGHTGPHGRPRDAGPPEGSFAHLGLHGPVARSGESDTAFRWSARWRAPNATSTSGSRAGCRSSPHCGGARVPRVPTGARVRIPSRADVGGRTRWTSRLGGRWHTPARTQLSAGSYCHPYTSEERELAVDVASAWVEICPVGERDLWDMTVAEAHHYVSRGGIVHKNCASDDDVGQYLSAEYDMIAFDEATEFTAYAYDMIRSRARTTKAMRAKGARPHIIAATNPGRRGHAYFKQIFVTSTDYGANVPQVLIPDGDDGWRPLPEGVEVNPDFGHRVVGFMPSTVADNPHMDPEYVRRLKTLPEKLQRQYLHGDWDVFAGQFFDEFRRSVTDDKGELIPWHVIEPFEIPGSWPKIRAIDWGFAAPFACVWLAWDPDGHCYAYREYYRTRQTPREQALGVLTAEANGEKTDRTVADPACWSQRDELTIAQQWAAHGLRAMKANNDRNAGWLRVREYLKPDPKGVPGLRVFNTCPNLIRTLPEMIHDKTRAEDLDTTLEDHIVDALRYGLMTRPRTVRVAKEEVYGMAKRVKDTFRRTRTKSQPPELGKRV